MKQVSRRLITPLVVLAIVSIIMLPPMRGGIGSAGMGPRAVESFGLEHPQQTSDSQPANLNIKDTFGGISLPDGILQAAADGRVLLYSVARLSEQDMRNPFEIRVQVAVAVTETVFEIGGIVEGVNGGQNTVILMTRPPAGVVKQTGKKQKDNVVRQVCSVGDIVAGFRIYAIGRDSIILSQGEKFVEIVRGRPVTIRVPVSAL